MIHPTKILLTVAFSLLSVLTAQAANTQIATTQAAKTSTIPISYLPFPPITAPGTYVLTGNLSFTGVTNTDQGAITIHEPIGGAVILDLKGFTITNANTGAQNNAILIRSFVPGGTNNAITIRNGTITFPHGVDDEQVSDVTITNVTFNDNPNPQTGSGPFVQAINFQTVSNAIVNNCHFISSSGGDGISDFGSLGGNSYSNNTFLHLYTSLAVGSYTAPNLVLDRCQFAAPPSN